MKVLHMSGETFKEKIQRASDILRLSAEFEQVCVRLSKVVVAERGVRDDDRRRIKKASVGGVAGGEKFIYRGVFLKFALDVSGFYGGHEFSQKAAGHELKGLRSFFQFITETNEDRLNIVLMTMVDYHGTTFSFL